MRKLKNLDNKILEREKLEIEIGLEIIKTQIVDLNLFKFDSQEEFLRHLRDLYEVYESNLHFIKKALQEWSA